MSINYKLFNGNCLELMSKLPDGSIDLVITDPPYLMDYKTNHRKDKTHEFCKAIANDENNNDTRTLLSNSFKQVHRVLKDGGVLLFL